MKLERGAYKPIYKSLSSIMICLSVRAGDSALSRVYRLPDLRQSKFQLPLRVTNTWI
jgi:hypothetical protein